jgi:hypothetical protein
MGNVSATRRSPKGKAALKIIDDVPVLKRSIGVFY